ncbi:patatin-like phospholipase family protein [Bacillus sp. KH172YL63]|uniref:patatin-like phospholipase family protein n=1 Tax=Bacillus sp. KH172YL63 TaxID=2709784 RepID=UPI0013E482E5|nr:patatin family protein [Bacillus sp. KH172YL63]BCB04369.1 patatin family protein [Bacillus sp. KH172YL63]
MIIEETGLVLEGGGMRGIYTAGALEYFLEKGVEFPYVIGVSAGACNAASYLSKQHGRNKKVNVDFIRDPKYLSWRNYWKTGELFGMDYVFDEIPNKLVPYDYQAFHTNSTEFVVGVTDCETGQPVYYARSDYGEDLLTIIRASSSLPFVAPVVEFASRHLLDGGISDPIPVGKAEQDGYGKNVVILTRNRGYYKKPSKFSFLLNRKYPQFPELQKTMMNRYIKYNQTIDELEEKERNGDVIIIQPQTPLKVGRIERNPQKLDELYWQGYRDAEAKMNEILNWSKKSMVHS